MTFSKQHTESCEKPTPNITRSFSDIVDAVYFKIGKRLIDIFLAATGLIILSPLFILIFIVLWFETKGNVFFFQHRPGFQERIFILFKFRTLSGNQAALPHGNFLRRFSLDEIPQLWNVIKGDMSLIGPRPLLPEYLELYDTTQHTRHNVLPGLTGWAQINGRNAISWEKKFELDVWYVKNRSFLLDMKILYLTFFAIFKRPAKQTGTTFDRFKRL